MPARRRRIQVVNSDDEQDGEADMEIVPSSLSSTAASATVQSLSTTVPADPRTVQPDNTTGGSTVVPSSSSSSSSSAQVKRPAEKKGGKSKGPRAEGVSSAHAQINDVDIISPFGPRFKATEEALSEPKETFAAGHDKVTPYAAASDPLQSLQVLIHAAGGLVGVDSESLLKSYTTFPVAPSGSASEGQLILYSIYRLVAANTPAGAELANALWIHYRVSLTSYLGVRLPQLQNDLRRLDDRFALFPWGEVISAADAMLLTLRDRLDKLKADESEAEATRDKAQEALKSIRLKLAPTGRKLADANRESLKQQQAKEDETVVTESAKIRNIKKQRKALRPPVSFARGMPESDVDGNASADAAAFADTVHWRDWLNQTSRFATVDAALKTPMVTKEERLWLLDATSEGAHPAVVATDAMCRRLIGIASAEPRDLAALLGITVRPPAAMGHETEFVMPRGMSPTVLAAVHAVLGVSSLALPPSSGRDVFEEVLAQYATLIDAVSSGGADEAKRDSALLYVFLYVWLPVRTGIGFDGTLGQFRARPISYSLVGHTGLLPLVGSALYATESAIGASPMAFTLAHELVKFSNTMIVGVPPIPSLGSIRDFLRILPADAVMKWSNTRHRNVNEFRRAELPLLSRLFGVIAHHGARPFKFADWMSGTLNGARWAQPVARLPVEQRTADVAYSLYQAAAERVDAPSADRLYSTEPVSLTADDPSPDVQSRGGVNYADFGGTAAFYLMNTLLARPSTSEPVLMLVVGAALGRLPAMLAYKHPWLWCACLPVTAVANNASTGLRATATDWITPIVNEMAVISGDATLAKRVFVMHEWTLMENHVRGVDIYNHAASHMTTLAADATPSSVFVVGNSLNAAVQFDVPEKLFSAQFDRLYADIAAHVASAERLTTFPLDPANERRLALPPTAAPLAPLLAEYGVTATNVYYSGTTSVVQTGALTDLSVGAQQRRRALLRSLGPGGSNDTLLKSLRDALGDALTLLDSDLSVTGELFNWQLLRIAVLAAALNRFRIDELIETTLPRDLVENLDKVMRMAGTKAYVHKDLLAAVDAQIRVAPGAAMQPQSELGMLLAALESDASLAGALKLPRVVIGPNGVAAMETRSIDAKTESARIALDQLNRFTMENGTRCLDALGEWSRAINMLAKLGIDDYRDNYWTFTKDNTAALEAAQSQVIDQWPGVVACLNDLIADGDAQVNSNDASLQVAYGPALLYAQMINTALFVAQRTVEAFNTDLRAGRAIEFRHQESPFLAWFGLQAQASQETISRLADLLFRDSRWILPLISAVSRNQTDGFIALGNRAALTAYQCAQLLMTPSDYEFFVARLDEEETKLRPAQGGGSGRGQAKLDAADAKDLADMQTQIRQQRRQFERLTDAFTALGDLFRAQSDSTSVPLSFFVDATSEFVGDLDATEARLRAQMTVAMRAIRKKADEVKIPSNAIEEQRVKFNTQIQLMVKLFQQLAFAYATGGYSAVISILAGTELRSEVLSGVQEEALRVDDAWQLDLEFEADSAEIDLIFPGQRDAARELKEWLAAFKYDAAPPLRTRVIPGRSDLIAMYEQPSDANDATADTDRHMAARRYLVLIPRGTAQGPSDEQSSFIKTFMAADRLRVLTLAASNLETLRQNHKSVMTLFERNIDPAKVDYRVVADYYAALLSDRETISAGGSASLMALSIQSDDHWLLASFGDLGASTPDDYPSFLKNQLFADDATIVASNATVQQCRAQLSIEVDNNALSSGSGAMRRILTNFLNAAYTNLAKYKAADDNNNNNKATYMKWRAYLLTPLPSFVPLGADQPTPAGTLRASLGAADWVMSFWWLQKAMDAHEGGAVDGASFTDDDFEREWSKNAVFKSLVKSMLPIGDGKNFLVRATADEKKYALLFSQLYNDNASRNRAKQVWETLVSERAASTRTFALDMMEPSDANIISAWIEDALDASTPDHIREAIKNDRDTLPSKLYNLAVFSRMIQFARLANQSDESREFAENLMRRMNETLARAETLAQKDAIVRKGTDVIQVPSFADIRASDQLKRAHEDYIATRLVIVSEQRRIWRAALGRLLKIMRFKSAPPTLAWWLRARASSWSQRLRMIEPELSATPAWARVIDAINRALAVYKERLVDKKKKSASLVPKSSLIVEAVEINRRFKEYNSKLATSRRTEESARDAANLLATALKPLDEVKSKELAVFYAGVASGEVEHLSLDRMVLQAEKKASQLEASRQKAASEEAASKREEPTPMQTDADADMPASGDASGHPILELFIGRLQDPAQRFDGYVLSAEDAVTISDSMAASLATDDRVEATLWADLAVSLSRHVQFVDAERNRVTPRVTAKEDTSLREFVRNVREANRYQDYAKRIVSLIANRLINDSLLYADLDSLQRPLDVIDA